MYSVFISISFFSLKKKRNVKSQDKDRMDSHIVMQNFAGILIEEDITAVYVRSF